MTQSVLEFMARRLTRSASRESLRASPESGQPEPDASAVALGLAERAMDRAIGLRERSDARAVALPIAIVAVVGFAALQFSDRRGPIADWLVVGAAISAVVALALAVAASVSMHHSVGPVDLQPLPGEPVTAYTTRQVGAYCAVLAASAKDAERKSAMGSAARVSGAIGIAFLLGLAVFGERS